VLSGAVFSGAEEDGAEGDGAEYDRLVEATEGVLMLMVRAYPATGAPHWRNSDMGMMRSRSRRGEEPKALPETTSEVRETREMSAIPLRPLGHSDLRVSIIGLGCNNFGRPGTFTEDQRGTTAVIHAAIDAGITFFDTADIYGYGYGRSETLMGNALRGRRDDVILASKFGHAEYESPLAGAKGSRAYVRAAIEGSLRRLQTDRIDLYQLHTPDPSTPIAETLAALHELVDEGKVRAIGHSNFSAKQLTEADRAAIDGGHPRFASSQNEYSLVHRGAEAALIPAAERHGLGVLPYFPLANGLLTGKFHRGGGPEDSRIMRQRPHLIDEAPWGALEKYAALCEEWGVGMLEATFAWLLSRPAIASVIAGATTIEQVKQNGAAAHAWSPSADELRAIDELFPLSR